MAGDFPGDDLREQREEMGYSLQEASRYTRVPMDYLRLLESGDLHKLPGPTFTQGFIQTYCTFLELEPARYLNRYRNIAPDHSPAQTITARNTRTGGMPLRDLPDAPKPRPRWVNEAIAWGTISAFLLLGWLTYASIVRPFAEDEDARVEAGVKVPEYHFEDDF